MSGPQAPDRYADAVLARRGELRTLRHALAGGHRAELRACLALSRLAAAAEIDAVLAQVRREASVHCAVGDRAARARLPGRLAGALAEIARTVHAGWAARLRPPLRRIATRRGLDLDAGWPRLPDPPVTEITSASGHPAEPQRRAAVRSLLAGAIDGAAIWRLAVFPLAALPLLGLGVPAVPGFGGTAPLAIGAGVAAVACAAVARRAAAERERLRRVADELVAAAAAALHGDLDRRLVEVEHTAGAALDAAVLRRRAAVDAELARLARDRSPDRSSDPPAGDLYG